MYYTVLYVLYCTALYCRSLPDWNGGKPFCFYSGLAGTDISTWKYEECDIPVCEVHCNRLGTVLYCIVLYCNL